MSRHLPKQSGKVRSASRWNGLFRSSGIVRRTPDAERAHARAEKVLQTSQTAIDDATQRKTAGEKMMDDTEAEYARQFPGHSLSGGAAQ